jgi:hypothetical protein
MLRLHSGIVPFHFSPASPCGERGFIKDSLHNVPEEYIYESVNIETIVLNGNLKT